MDRLTTPVLLLVPHELLGVVLLIFLVLGGLCRIIGARRISNGLITTAIAIPFVTVLVEALFNGLFAVLPPSLVQVVAWFVLGIVYLVIFGALMSFLFGQRTWEQAKGNLLADAIKGSIRIALTWPMLIVLVLLSVYLWLK